MLTAKVFRQCNAAIAMGLALALSACGGSGPHTTPPPVSPFEMLYTPAGSQVGMVHVDPSTGALGTATTTSLGPMATGVSITTDPQSRFIFVSDNPTVPSTASVHVLAINQNSGNLSEVSGSPFPSVIQGGMGHAVGQLAIDPAGSILYLGINGAAGPGIETFTVDRTTGALKSIGVASTSRVNTISRILVHPSGKFVYADDNSGQVLGFAVGSTGALTPLPGSPFPAAGTLYDMAIYPSGKFLFAGVKFTDTGQSGFEVWSIDGTTGALQESSSLASGYLDSGAVLLMDPGGNFLYNVFGSQIKAYSVDSITGALTPGLLSLVQVGFTIFLSANIDPQGKFMFISGAKGDVIMDCAINSSTGSVTQGSTASSLPFSPGAMTIVKLP